MFPNPDSPATIMDPVSATLTELSPSITLAVTSQAAKMKKELPYLPLRQVHKPKKHLIIVKIIFYKKLKI